MSLPSTSISKCAWTLSSIFIFISVYFIVQSIASLSINSRADGVIPLIKIADTALHAFSAESKGTSSVISFVGNEISLKTIFVITPKVPSLPTINEVKSYPVEFFKTLAPVHIISPVGKTTSKFKT